MCQSAPMFLLGFMTIILVPKPSIQTAPCFDDNAKQLLHQHTVATDVKIMLDGKHFIDIWTTNDYAEMIDCSISKYSAQKDGINVDFHNVRRDGKEDYFSERWTNKGAEGIFDSFGKSKNPGLDPTHYNELIYIFHVDDYSLGYMGCGNDENEGDYVKTSISILKDKMEDSKVLESLDKAKEKMKALKSIIPEPMVKLTNKQCPKNV